jgi:hypothetical protein
MKHVLIVGMALMLMSCYSKELRTLDVEAQIHSTENKIQNYENFYTMDAQIKATAGNVKIAKEKYTLAGAETKAQAEIEYFGIKQILNNQIAEYNAKSKMVTRNGWKAADLPYQYTLEEVLK